MKNKKPLRVAAIFLALFFIIHKAYCVTTENSVDSIDVAELSGTFPLIPIDTIPPTKPNLPLDTIDLDPNIEPLDPIIDPTNPNIPSVDSPYSVGATPGSITVNSYGGAEYAIPIKCPNGGPLYPDICIMYNSQDAGYGIAGYGFSIKGLSSITRGNKNLFKDKGVIAGIKYNSDDNLFLDGKRLVLISGTPYQ